MFEVYQHDQIWYQSFSGGIFPIGGANSSYFFGSDENKSPLIKDKKSCKGAAARIYNNKMAECELTQTEMNLNCDESFK